MMPGAVFMEGDRIELRTPEEEDAEFLRDSFNHPEVRQGLSYTRPQNLDQEREWLESQTDSEDINLMICRDGEPVGVISLKQREKTRARVREVGIWIARDHQREGYGTEAASLAIDYAFDDLNCHRVVARAFESNEGSRRLWQKLGFTEEGEMREHIFREGGYENAYWYGLLESEW